MAEQYAFRNMVLGEVSNVANDMAAQGYSPVEMYKEGNRMYILFSQADPSDPELAADELDEVYTAMGALADRILELEAQSVPMPVE